MPTRCPILHIISFSFQQFNKMVKVPLLEIIKLRLTKDNLLKVTLHQTQRQICPTPCPNLLNIARQSPRKYKTSRLMSFREKGVLRSVKTIIVDL